MVLTVALLTLLAAIRDTHALAMNLQALDFEAILTLCKYFMVLLVLLLGFQDEVRSNLDYEQVPILMVLPLLGRLSPTDHLVNRVVNEGLQTVPSYWDLSFGILNFLEMAKLVGGSRPEFEGLCK
jgi:hypothetical protein